jgi:alkanesulfonate monooxygenase SsuD/methylene tetrahydromethanopterin reductase-like flavin-dependent oxidoreductase (luciferase family)
MFFSGNSPNSAEFAGANRFGLCFSFHSPEVVAQTVARYRAAAAAAGWEPAPEQIVYRGFVVVADTEAEAAALEADFLPAHMAHLIAANKARQLGAKLDDGAQAPAGFGLGRLLFAGTPDRVVEQVRAFQEATGVGVIDLIFNAGRTPPDAVRRGIELFGRAVLPRIRAFGQVPAAVA